LLSGIQIADIAADSKNLVIAVLTAYIKRLTTGEGDYADISIKTMAEWHSIFKNTDACAEPVFNLQEAISKIETGIIRQEAKQ